MADVNTHGADADAVFAGLDGDAARALAERFGTPVYLIAEAALRGRWRTLADAAAACTPEARLAWSVKTNPLRGVLEILREEGAWAEVTSDLEYALARRTGVPGEAIVLNGPVRADATLERAMGDGAMVHADRVDEIARLDAAAGRAGGKTVAIGLRVSFDDGGADWDRFGLSPGRGELAAALAQIDASAHLVLGGLHAHVGTNLRDVGRFERLGAQLADLARALGRPLRWIDAGGGLAGANPRWDEAPRRHAWPDARAWCAAVLGPLVAANAAPRYVLEPGRTVIEPAGALLARVAGVRVAADGRPAYVIDGGINAVPTALTYRHPVRTPGAAGPVAPSALYGPLCLQKDRIAEAALLPRLGRGDLVLVEGVGAYNVSRAVAFIQPRPGALLWRGGDEACWLREPEDVDDLMAREPPRTRSGGARIGAPKR